MIQRVSAVMSAFKGSDRALSVSEIGRRSGIPKASVSRIITELIEVGFLERNGAKVGLGMRLFELGERATRPSDLKKFTLPSMVELRNATRQTVHLAVLQGHEVVYIQKLRSSLTPPLPSRVGGRLPAYATGVGKALLAFSSDTIVDEILAQPLKPIGPRTITNPDVLRAQFVEIRENRVAFEREESTENVGCAAAPILDFDGKPIAAISISGRLDHIDLPRLGPAIATSAMALTREAARLNFTAAG
jgi:DNA-binding IclR family transcriptional regulator